MKSYSEIIKSITTIEELQTFHNERIIRLAYLNILGREVDPEGLENQLLVFRKSMSIEELFLKLKHSPETKSKYNFIKNNTNRKDIRKKTNEPTNEMLRQLGTSAKYFYRSLKKESQHFSAGNNE